MTVRGEGKKSLNVVGIYTLHFSNYWWGVGSGGNNGATVSRTKDDSINTIWQWQCDVESILRVPNMEFGILQPATGWTVRGSNLQNVKPGSETHSTSYLMRTGFSTSGEATRV